MIRYIYTLLLIAMPFSLFAQQMTISGKVLDGDFDNAPLVGATIKVEYGDNKKVDGTYTDLDGFFSLEISGEATEFSVSFIGYETQFIKIEQDRSEYEVVLHSNSNRINEVVVTGTRTLNAAD